MEAKKRKRKKINKKFAQGWGRTSDLVVKPQTRFEFPGITATRNNHYATQAI